MAPQLPKILIIDDEPDLAEIIADFVEDDFAATIATDPVEAQGKIRDEKFDLVITDVNMPGCQGETIVSLVKKHHPKTPVILLTGQSIDEPETRAALDAGAVGYIGKPFTSPEDILPKLKAACADADN